MNHLISARTNIMYSKTKEEGKEEYKRFQEVILLVDTPSYKYSNEGEIIRERGINELRFTVSEKGFGDFIDLLTKLKDIQESELS
jgi:hypothetical protein